MNKVDGGVSNAVSMLSGERREVLKIDEEGVTVVGCQIVFGKEVSSENP